MPEQAPVAFSILGRAFRTYGVSDQLADWLNEFWKYPDRGAARSNYQIEIHSRAAAPQTDGTWAPLSLPLPDRTLPFLVSGRLWRAGSTVAGSQLELRDRSSHVDIWGWPLAPDPATLHFALYVMMTEALRSSGLLPIHAAVATNDEGATAWLGASGQGKSTTLLRAARAGWRPIAEDLSWLDPATLTVYGWDRSVRVWPDTLERFFPDLSGPAAADGKRMIAYDAVGGLEPRSGVLTQVALLTRDPESRSRWEPVTAIDTTRALWEATGVPLSQSARDHAARAIGDIVTRVPSAKLVLGAGDAGITPSG